MAANRLVPAFEGGPLVTIARGAGLTGPRRLGDRYFGITADDRVLVADYAGRTGGIDRWQVQWNRTTSMLYGSLAFLAQRYATADPDPTEEIR